MDDQPNLLPLLVIYQFTHSVFRSFSGLRIQSLSNPPHMVVSCSMVFPTDVIGPICHKNLCILLGYSSSTSYYRSDMGQIFS